MGKGLSNKAVGQAGEFAVCAQLGKLGLVATPFSGNVPYFDVLVTDENLRTLPIQVKASFGSDNWNASPATEWIDIKFEELKEHHKSGKPKFKQTILRAKEIKHSDLIYVYIWLSPEAGLRDRYFVLTKKDIQDMVIDNYEAYLKKFRGERPVNSKSVDCRVYLSKLKAYEDRWELIQDRLKRLL